MKTKIIIYRENNSWNIGSTMGYAHLTPHNEQSRRVVPSSWGEDILIMSGMNS